MFTSDDGSTSVELPNDQEVYLETCNKLELKSLEVSRASKALNKLKEEEEALRVQREQWRKKLVGDAPSGQNNTSKLPNYPPGHRSGRFA